VRGIFGPKEEELTEDWRKLRSEELRNLYSSPSVIRMIRSRKMRWARHVAHIWERTEVPGRKETTRKTSA
jgi:hypothetical protein